MRSTASPRTSPPTSPTTGTSCARGFDRLINVLGADHHGYVARLKAAVAALGADPDALEVLIMQFVNVVEGGERASMSKRRGDFVTLDELIEEIGVDADALVHALALARLDGRPRPHAGAGAVDREPRLLRPVRARADRLDAPQGRRRAGRRRAGRGSRDGLRSSRPSARWSSGCSPSRPRWRRPPSGARRTGSPPTRSSSRRLHRLLRDCRVVGAEPRRSSPSGSRSASRPSG